jgi:hypothetical protein
MIHTVVFFSGTQRYIYLVDAPDKDKASLTVFAKLSFHGEDIFNKNVYVLVNEGEGEFYCVDETLHYYPKVMLDNNRLSYTDVAMWMGKSAKCDEIITKIMRGE